VLVRISVPLIARAAILSPTVNGSSLWFARSSMVSRRLVPRPQSFCDSRARTPRLRLFQSSLRILSSLCTSRQKEFRDP